MGTETTTGVHIRWMIRRDMAEVLAAERESSEYAWTEADFSRCLRQRNRIGMVAEHDGRVAGFMIYELHEKRIELLNFAVVPSCRRGGIGTRLAATLVDKLSGRRWTSAGLTVRERNLAAQVFFKAQGFEATQVLRNHYEDSGEDAILMELRAGDGRDPSDPPADRTARHEER